jgi:aspartyl-tRNA(Asn)/glutamyl-tRNA(Gln) amidotransferase subunit C
VPGHGSPEPGALTPVEVRRVAELAGLEVTEDEMARLANELGGLLRRFSSLGGVDTEDTEETEGAEGPVGPEGSLRPDVPGADPLAERPGEGAPEWRDGFFTVPRLASHDPGGEDAS